MWIEYFEIVNFKNIRTGLNAKSIAIDFSKRENVICLIIGPNGIGKTTIMSLLTPFATLGNLDIRDSNGLIVENESGYKKIIINNGSNRFEIEHFYTPLKGSHTVKSYIKLNGVELNENGNVTSFKEIVYKMLFIDMDYLKLIRLGDNVTNLIKLKSTDRKTFMSKFIDSVDIYLNLLKKLSGDVRDLKAIIARINDKLSRNGITDVMIEEKNIKDINHNIQLFTDELESCKKNSNRIEFQLQELDLSDNYRNELSSITTLLKKCEKVLDKTYNDSEVEDIKKRIEKLSESISKYEVVIHTDKQRLTDKLESLDRELTAKKRIQYELLVEESNSNIKEYEKYLKGLHEKRVILEKTLPNVIYKNITKEEVDTFIVKIKNIQHGLNMTYEFGKKPIKEAIRLIKDEGNINEFIASRLVAIEKQHKNKEYTYLDKIIDKYENVTVPDGCECVLKNMYNDVMSIKKMKPVNPSGLESPEYYQMVQTVYENIQYLLNELSNESEMIRKLPDDIQKMFLIDNIFEQIKSTESIYNDKVLNKFMSNVAEIHNYDVLTKEIEEVIGKLNYERENSKTAFITKELDGVNDRIEVISSDIEELKENINSLTEKVITSKNELESLNDLLFAINSYQDVKNEYQVLDDKITKKQELEIEKRGIVETINKLNYHMKTLHDNLKERELAFKEYVSLTKELRNAMKLYDSYVLLRDSSSNTDGIPLAFIKSYIRNIQTTANELLDLVYDGKVYFEEFILNASEFRLPFVKNGKEIPDISYASQGETGFLNLAFSSALRFQNSTGYNIPLLDEVDSTFDTRNREGFLGVINKANDLMDVEQAFVISHNNLFNKDEVDIIDFYDLSNNKLDIYIE